MLNDKKVASGKGQVASGKDLYGKPFVNEHGEKCRYATRVECLVFCLLGWAAFACLCALIYGSRCLYQLMFN